MIRSFDHAEFPLQRLLEHKRQTLTVVLPAREVADTVGQIVERILALDGLVDQVLVVDDDSEDGSADAARAAGAEVRRQGDLMPQYGPVLGKGDGMWRALEAVRGDLVAFVDADTRDFDPRFITGLLGPLLTNGDVALVKGAYRRPFVVGDEVVPDGGGRVSWLMAKPLLRNFYPSLSGLMQPLAGEIAAPRSVLTSIPFSTGYAVEMAMLLDIHDRHGAGSIVQVDIGERLNPHQPLPDLLPMAETVLAVMCRRLHRDGRLQETPGPVEIVERPPLESVAVASR